MATYLFGSLTVQIEQGDLTPQKVDAIVNAANKHLQHGGGVAGAIVARGGSIIQQESNEWVHLHGPVTHNHPAITGPGSLFCKYIIHAVGPIWGEGAEVDKLICTIKSSLLTANDLKCKSVAFPAISTGIYGFPVKLASECFLHAIEQFSKEATLLFLETVKIVLFDTGTLQVFLDTFSTGLENG